MKSVFKLAIFFFLGTLSLKGFSQVNLNDIYQTGSTWYESHTLEQGMGVRYQSNYLIKIGSDTTINATTYKKLILIRMPSGLTNGVDYGTIGGIRVNSRQVHFIRTKTLPNTINGNTEYQSFTINGFPLLSEIPLYDFNLTQGTTLSWKQNNPTVLAVGSVMVNSGLTLSTYRFWSSTPYHETWKEGLGSEQGFFGSYRSFNYTNRFEPICFSSPTLTYPANCTIPLISGVKELSTDKSVTIYPNPAVSDILNIAITDNFKVQRIEIYNALGKVVFQKEYHTSPSQINLNLNSGIYSIRFITENGEIITRKIVKQ